jgi:hypothetical protein
MILMAQQKEARLVNEWLQLEHPTALQWKRVRLGPLPDKELARMYQVTLRWADAIYVEDGTVTIVEAKMAPGLGAISQLKAYAELFRETPEFSQYSAAPVKLLYLCTRRDNVAERMCAAEGIEYAVYTPSWIYEVQPRR